MRLSYPETPLGKAAAVVSSAAIGLGAAFAIEQGVNQLDPLPRLDSAATRTHNVDVEGCAGVLLLDRDQTVGPTEVSKLCADFAGKFVRVYANTTYRRASGGDPDPQNGDIIKQDSSANVILPRKLSFVRGNLITARSIAEEKASRSQNDKVIPGVGGLLGLLASGAGLLGLNPRRQWRLRSLDELFD
jgi:hypothetical protein